jgi:hypothetical protein
MWAEAYADVLYARADHGEINHSAIHGLMRGFLDQPAFYPEHRASLMEAAIRQAVAS